MGGTPGPQANMCQVLTAYQKPVAKALHVLGNLFCSTECYADTLSPFYKWKKKVHEIQWSYVTCPRSHS